MCVCARVCFFLHYIFPKGKVWSVRDSCVSLFIGYVSGVRKCALVVFTPCASAVERPLHAATFQPRRVMAPPGRKHGRSRPGGTQPSWGDAAILGGRSLTPSSDEHAFFLAVSSPPPALPPDTLPTSCHSPWLHTYCSILFYKLGSQDTSVIFVLQIFLILADTNHVPIAT